MRSYCTDHDTIVNTPCVYHLTASDEGTKDCWPRQQKINGPFSWDGNVASMGWLMTSPPSPHFPLSFFRFPSFFFFHCLFIFYVPSVSRCRAIPVYFRLWRRITLLLSFRLTIGLKMHARCNRRRICLVLYWEACVLFMRRWRRKGECV